MATTANKPKNATRSSPVRRAKAAQASNGRARAKKPEAAAKKPTAAAKKPTAAAKKPTALAKKPTAAAKKPTAATKKPMAAAKKPMASAAKKPIKRAAKTAGKMALKAIVRKAARAGAGAVRSAADRAVELGRTTLESSLSRRPPIQVSIDIAVPPVVAWSEWMSLQWVTEGVHRIGDVERDGERLYGQTAGPHSSDWVAEIVDEREQEAFAWRSVEGTDCAGLITFHQLSERLTRLELDLDVVPTTPAEMLALSTHLARRRAESEMRRFKARVEFINPDEYEAAAEQNGSGPAKNGNK